MKTHVLCVHGIGYHIAGDAPGGVRKSAREKGDDGCLDVRELHWANWHRPEPKPAAVATCGATGAAVAALPDLVSEGGTASEMCRALVTAAHTDFEPPETPHRWRRLAYWLDIPGVAALQAVLFTLPYFIVFALWREAHTLLPHRVFAQPTTPPGVSALAVAQVLGAVLLVALVVVLATGWVRQRLVGLSWAAAFFTALRRPTLLTVAAVYHTASLPLARFATIKGIGCLFGLISWGLLFMLIGAAGVMLWRWLVGPVDDELARTFGEPGTLGREWGRWAIIFLLVIAALEAARRWLADPVKFLADIARYTGDRRHRRRLRYHVYRSLRGVVRPGDRVVLAGHSLGSIIAIDFLRFAGHGLRGASSVTLVTGGSPALRLFHRFFPAHYPRPSALAADFDGRYQAFAWVNVYRPLDPVGGGLRLAEASATPRKRDVLVCKWMFHRWFPVRWVWAQHQLYFSDGDLYRAVRVFVRLIWRRASPVARPSLPAVRPADRFGAGRPPAWHLAAAVVVALLACGWLTYWRYRGAPAADFAAEQAEVEQLSGRAVRTKGTVRAWEYTTNLRRVIDRPLPLVNAEYGVTVAFTAADGNPVARAEPINVDGGAAFEWAAVNGVGWEGTSRVATRAECVVAYAPDDPGRCYLPEYLQQSPRAPAFYNLWMGVFTLAMFWVALFVAASQAGEIRRAERR